MRHDFIIRWVNLLLATLFVLAGVGIVSLAAAQGDAETWAEPANLSLSGTAGAPQIVDLGDELLVFWEDAVDHFAFVRGREGAWSAPTTAEFPFATPAYYPDLNESQPTPIFSPQLVYDGSGFIHAFWEDGEAAYHSRVPSEAFASFAEWSVRQQVAEGVAQMAVTTGADDHLHLVYVRRLETAELPAGVYYRGSADGGATWSDPQLLYASRYFRLPDEEDANLQIAAAGVDVYVAVDDPAQARILFIRSEDEGASWRQPSVIDRREADDGVNDVAPSGVRLASVEDDVHLAWQAGHQGRACGYYYRHSEDGGRSWGAAEPLYPGVLNCSQEVRVLSGDQNVFLVATAYDGEVVQASSLSVWLDDGWQEPAPQAALSGFTHPETFRPVTYGCGRDMIVKDERVIVASCGRSVGQDIWLSSRPTSLLVEQLRTTPEWAPPATAPPPADQEEAVIVDPDLVAGDDDGFHAFWSQAPSPESIGKEIYYARWASGEWSRPIVVASDPAGKAVQPAAAMTADGRLLLVWSGGTAGDLFFSWAPVEGATQLSEWREPRQLPSPQPATSAPQLLVDQEGVIYVFYAVPLNEGRGIYLTTSADQGENWSEPVTVFDGAAAGWAMVDAPRATAADGLLHLMWEQRSLPTNASETTLYYARSDDDGRTWSAPRALEGVQAEEARAVWGQIVAADGRVAHRAWQEWDGAQLVLWHQHSRDGGLNWSRPARVGGFADTIMPASLLQDAGGRPYLLRYLAPAGEGGVSVTRSQLQLWQWQPETEEWASLESVDVTSPGNAALAAAASPTGEMAVVLAAREDGAPVLSVIGRELPAPERTPTRLPTLTATPPPTAEPTATRRPQPTATPVFPTANEGGGPLGGLTFLGADSRVVGGLLALIVTVVVVFVVLIAVMGFRSGRQR